MITGEEAERLAAERLHELCPKDNVISRGWAEDGESYAPMLSLGRDLKGSPSFFVNKKTGETEEFHYRPNSPIAARLKAMKRTKHLSPKVIIRPQSGREG
ncbi:hypothetical protein [Actinotignum schaalii]|uniref:hypothetical protein n=1 Tax=Actinotignum schaalii TaxID=59505 RepID=UPI0012DF9772|nr:hypothetical protein [Actinotignum schaalii]